MWWLQASVEQVRTNVGSLLVNPEPMAVISTNYNDGGYASMVIRNGEALVAYYYNITLVPEQGEIRLTRFVHTPVVSDRLYVNNDLYAGSIALGSKTAGAYNSGGIYPVNGNASPADKPSVDSNFGMASPIAAVTTFQN